MGAFLDKPKTDKINESGSTSNGSLRYGLAAMQGWRIEMEDAHVSKTSLPPPFNEFAFFGVFDGHAGSKIAKFSAQNLLDTILQTYQFQTLSAELNNANSGASFVGGPTSIGGGPASGTATPDAGNHNYSPSSRSISSNVLSNNASSIATAAKSTQEPSSATPSHSQISSVSTFSTISTTNTDGTGGGMAANQTAHSQTQPSTPPGGTPAPNKLTLTQKQMSLIVSGLKNGFLMFDEKMRHLPQLHSENERSGTTAVCALITPSHVFLTNLGDSRGLFARAGTVEFATEDHKPYLPKERERIVNAGGSVMIQRVNGSLAVSRALGDYDYKNAVGLQACDQLVSPEPDVTILERDVSSSTSGSTVIRTGGTLQKRLQRLQSSVSSSGPATPPPGSPGPAPNSPTGSDSGSPLTSGAQNLGAKTPTTGAPQPGDNSRDEFLILACDGVFDVMTNQELCEFVRSRLCVTNRLELICNQILDCCLSKGSKDNMSVILITFPGAPQVSTDAIQREQQFEKILSDRINEIVQHCDNTNDVDIDYVLRALMTQEIPGLPPGAGLHAKRSLVESVLDSIKAKAPKPQPQQPSQSPQPEAPQQQQITQQTGSAPSISSAKLSKSPL